MAIISISLQDEILEEIDKLQKELGFSGRSEVVRAGVRMLLADSKDKGKLEGKLNSVLLLIHAQKVEDTVTEVKHEFEDIISTQIHNHLREDKCLEVFILEGDATRVKQLVQRFQTSRKLDYVKLIVA
ncbi:putative nickel-responsive regulator [ANME-1 cluster archaeon GoMg2]|nr:putative nickel-responsive regulator [ANME-1 cluster archaeon GoMg2]